MSRGRYVASVFSEKAGRRVTVGRFPEKWRADRHSVVAALQPGFRDAQVHDQENSE